VIKIEHFVALSKTNITAITILSAASAFRAHLFIISETRNIVQETHLKHNN